MEVLKVYHNPRCSKSRMALAHLEENNLPYEIVDYLKNVPTKKELESVLKKLGIPAKDLVRKGEAVYKELYKNADLTESQWIDAMIEHPKLIERPIIIRDNKAVIARPTELIDTL